MSPDKIQHYGDELYQSLVDRQPVTPLTEREAAIGIDDAYRIQLCMNQRRVDKGETVIGKKIGVTSKAVQQMLKVYQPDFGQLLSGMVYSEGEAIPVNTLIAPRAAAEVAFILKRHLDAPRVTAAHLPSSQRP